MPIEITTKLPTAAHLGEIYQSMTMKQALLRKLDKNHYERITPFVLCRDFLVDVYTFAKAKRDFEIYGMTFAGKTEEPDYSGLYLLVQFPNEKAKKAFHSNLAPIVLGLETLNGIPETKVHDLSGLESLVCGNSFWLSSCLTLSLYTFLLRVCCYEFDIAPKWWVPFGKLKNTDAKYVASIAPSTWEAVVSDLSILKMPSFCGFDSAKEHLYTIHHNSGFVSVFGRHSEVSDRAVRQNNHWKAIQKLGLTTAIKETA